MKELKWIVEKRKLSDLIPLDRNPFGKITESKKEILKRKLIDLGVFDVATIDKDNTLLSFNKRHFILKELYGEEYELDVKVPNRNLTEIERKEIILSSNIHEGDWDLDVIKLDFDDVDLLRVGLNSVDLISGNEFFETNQQPEKRELKNYNKVHFLISCSINHATSVLEIINQIRNYPGIEIDQTAN